MVYPYHVKAYGKFYAPGENVPDSPPVAEKPIVKESSKVSEKAPKSATETRKKSR